jgi:hypothetical protein
MWESDMKIRYINAFRGDWVSTTHGEFIRYSSHCWKAVQDTPTGDIEEDVFDSDLGAQLEAAYQEYIK